jgi:NADH:ubiquinone oxidoreductase subunit 3 (subunit A)
MFIYIFIINFVMCQSKVCRSKVLRFQVMFYILLQATVTFNVEIIFFFVSQFSVMITTCQMGLRQFVHIL